MTRHISNDVYSLICLRPRERGEREVKGERKGGREMEGEIEGERITNVIDKEEQRRTY